MKKKMPRIQKATFIRRHPNLPVKELVALAKEKGLTLTVEYVYNVRSHDKAKPVVQSQDSEKMMAKRRKREKVSERIGSPQGSVPIRWNEKRQCWQANVPIPGGRKLFDLVDIHGKSLLTKEDRENASKVAKAMAKRIESLDVMRQTGLAEQIRESGNMKPIVLDGEGTVKAFKTMVLMLGTERARRLIIEVEEAVTTATGGRPMTETELVRMAGPGRRYAEA